jgi:hypothetical protein
MGPGGAETSFVHLSWEALRPLDARVSSVLSVGGWLVGANAGPAPACAPATTGRARARHVGAHERASGPSPLPGLGRAPTWGRALIRLPRLSGLAPVPSSHGFAGLTRWGISDLFWTHFGLVIVEAGTTVSAAVADRPPHARRTLAILCKTPIYSVSRQLSVRHAACPPPTPTIARTRRGRGHACGGPSRMTYHHGGPSRTVRTASKMKLHGPQNTHGPLRR